jgi:hypothetical protein
VSAASARDIECVLVTGAGASREFGVNGTKLPLMREWSDDLVQRLGSRGFGYLDATGLRRDMPAEEFEAVLGRFLRSVEAFNRIEQLLEPSSQFPEGQTAFVPPASWSAWHSQVSFHLDQIIGVIHESLYQLYASPSVDHIAAERSYAGLVGALGLGQAGRWVYATTNYDTIGEDTLTGLGQLPDVGDVGTSGERDIRVERLLDGMPRYVPVIHLHGRVGWFRRREGRAVSSLVQNYAAGNAPGVPIVMLPDLDKDYDTDPVISSLWQQFGEALSRARRVLVLGHSLHDEALIERIRGNVDPPERVGVTYLPNADDSKYMVELVRERLPGAAPLPAQFGADTGVEGIREWVALTQEVASA